MPALGYREPLIERLGDKFVFSSDGCWMWTANTTPKGYGHVWFNDGATKKQRRAHRVMYELLVGPIPDGMTIDHLCRNRACVNPAHMDVVSMAENTLRGDSPSARHARKTRCIHGHLFDATNTRIRPNGARDCRKCHTNTFRRWLRDQSRGMA